MVASRPRFGLKVPRAQGSVGSVIASVAFRRFKALRSTHLSLGAFNVVVGPNGSGKTSLLDAVGRLKTLAALEPSFGPAVQAMEAGPEIEFRFSAPFDSVALTLRCVSDTRCDLLQLDESARAAWPSLRKEAMGLGAYAFDEEVLAQPSRIDDPVRFCRKGQGMAGAMYFLKTRHPDLFGLLRAEVLRLFPEYTDFDVVRVGDAHLTVSLSLPGEAPVHAENLSQGTLFMLGFLLIAFDPQPPATLCIEEMDRGIHPRLLREVRDTLYRLSYPTDGRRPTQVIATTQSPYMLDQFREHPEEVVVMQKEGSAAHFKRLTDIPHFAEILREGSLGDLWYSGIFGGVPPEG